MTTKRHKMTTKRHKTTTETQNDHNETQNDHKEMQNDQIDAKWPQRDTEMLLQRTTKIVCLASDGHFQVLLLSVSPFFTASVSSQRTWFKSLFEPDESPGQERTVRYSNNVKASSWLLRSHISCSERCAAESVVSSGQWVKEGEVLQSCCCCHCFINIGVSIVLREKLFNQQSLKCFSAHFSYLFQGFPL